jgi:hypothetical protein
MIFNASVQTTNNSWKTKALSLFLLLTLLFRNVYNVLFAQYLTPYPLDCSKYFIVSLSGNIL